MDAAVGNELFQCQSCDLPADGVERGHGDGLGGVVDDQIHTGDGFQRADVAAFPADDAALHFVVGQRHHGNSGFGGVVSGAALNGRGDDLPGGGLGLVLQLCLDLLDLHGRVVTHILFHALQQVLPGLLLGQTGNALQLFQLLLAQLVCLCLGFGNLGQLLRQFLFLAFECFGLLVKGGFLLLQTTLLLAQLGAALLDFLVVFCTRSMDFILGFQKQFLLAAFTAADRFVDQAGSFQLRGADLPFRDLLAVNHTNHKTDRDTDHNANDGKNNLVHNLAAHLLR